MNSKGQGAIEYLLIIGAAVIIAAIVIGVMMGLSTTGTEQVEEAGAGDTYATLYEQQARAQGNEYIPTGATEVFIYEGEDGASIKSVLGDELSDGTQVTVGGTTYGVADGEVDTDDTMNNGTIIYIKGGIGGSTVPADDLVPQELIFDRGVTYSGPLGKEILRANGDPIGDLLGLQQAYAAGELVIYVDGTEVSTVEKDGSARTSFESLFEYEFSPSQYLLRSPEECSRVSGIVGNLQNKYVKITSAPNEPSFEGTHYKVYYDYGCSMKYTHPAYGTGTWLYITNFSTGSSYAPNNKTAGWVWEVYEYVLVYGSGSGSQIGVDPATGTITGNAVSGGTVTVDYYHLEAV